MSNRLFCSLFVLIGVSPAALAQCLEWHAFPHDPPQPYGQVTALQVFDDGHGPALYVGGELSGPPFGPRTIRRWNGVVFDDVPQPPGSELDAMLSYDDGSGPALYAATWSFGVVSKWNGSTWQQLGAAMNNRVYALAFHDDGTGLALYAGGFFTMAGNVPAHGVAKWDGTNWVALGTGPGNGSEQAFVMSLASFDDGSGPALYAGGTFAGPTATASPNLAKWRAGVWSGVGSGTNDRVSRLVPWDDGSGPGLFVMGLFTSPQMHIARWNGTTMSSVGGGLAGVSIAAEVLDDGTGEQLWVAGSTTPSSSALPSLTRWNGTSWTPFAIPPPAHCQSYGFAIGALAAFDEGAGPHVFAGTGIGALGLVLGELARANGTVWERVGPPLKGLNGTIRSLEVHDDGSGPALYAGGEFCQADEADVVDVARFDGETWHAVGNQLGGRVEAMTSVDLPSGPRLYAADHDYSFPHQGARLSRLNGSAWISMFVSSDGLDSILALEHFGTKLYVGGTIHTSSPNLLSFSDSGTFGLVSADGQVNALRAFDDGQGAALYAAGTFSVVAGVAANRIAKFDGISWTPLSSGMDAVADTLVGFDDGSGPAMYAGGAFTTAGGVPASCIAKWNGTSWSAVGAGLNAQVLTLGVFDDGSGPALYAGGNFSASGNVPMQHIARWNGTSWSAVGGNIDGTVWALKSFDDGTGPGAQLFAGGVFHHAGSLPSENLAAWRGCGSTAVTKFCFGDGSDGACPCGNVGLPNRGCDNSVATGGARLNATGTTNPDTIVLHAGGELPNAPTLLFQGSVSLSQPILFGDGMRCVGGNLKRLFTTNAVGGAVNVPDATQTSISARSAALGDPLVPGSVRSYQTWYRDPNLSFCAPPSGDAWNLSNAVRVVW